MKFSDWQIDRLRSRLLSYRNKRGQNGRSVPWKRILFDILMCPDTAHVFPEDGSEPEFREEALRRFGAGINVLTPDKLEDIRVFLTREKFIKPKELDDDPEDIEEALALHSYLASSSVEARAYLATLPRLYEAERVGEWMKERFTLNFKLDPSGDFLRAESIYEREVDQEYKYADLEAKDDYKSCHQYRRGFGIVCTNQNLLYLFMHGPVRQDLMNYIQIAINEPSDKVGSLRFMVSGLKLPVTHLPPSFKKDDKGALLGDNKKNFVKDYEETLVNFNILDFIKWPNKKGPDKAAFDALLNELANR